MKTKKKELDLLKEVLCNDCLEKFNARVFIIGLIKLSMESKKNKEKSEFRPY